jgi:adenylate cyclase
MAKNFLGDWDGGIEQLQLALRLSPLDPRIFLAQQAMSFAHFLAGRFEEATSWAMQAIRQQPNYPGGYKALSASLAMQGQSDEARAACSTGIRLDPNWSISMLRATTAFRRQDVERFVAAYRLAGLPE